VPFASTPDEIRALTDAALAEADELVATAIRLAVSGGPGDVLQPLDDALDALALADGRGAFLASVGADEALRDAGQEADERLSTWRVELPFRDDLAGAISGYAATPPAAALDGEARRFLDHLQRDIRRAGHGLPAEVRAEVR
jgi:Zn-dependent oligopeptidase